MSDSNCCFLTYIQIFQEAGKVVWYSHLLKHFPQFVVIHAIKGFGIVSKTEVDVSLEFSSFFPWSKQWQPTPVHLPEKFCGQRSLEGYSWGGKESNMPEHTTHTLSSYLFPVASERKIKLPHQMYTVLWASEVSLSHRFLDLLKSISFLLSLNGTVPLNSISYFCP